MTNHLKALSVIFFIQILVVLAIWLIPTGQSFVSERLLPLADEELTALSVTDADKSTVQFTNKAGDWYLDSGLPVDNDKFSRVLLKLFTTQVDWPVATSEAAASRFEVAKDNYQKVIHANSVAGEIDIYLGTSPGFRQGHVRLNGEDEIYAIEVANYELSTDENEWFDKGLLQAEGELLSVENPSRWSLISTSDGWLANGQVANLEAVTDIINRLKTLRVDNLVVSSGEPLFELLIVDSEGEYSLTLGLEGEDNYWIKSSRIGKTYGLPASSAFSLPVYIVEALNVEKAVFEH